MISERSLREESIDVLVPDGRFQAAASIVAFALLGIGVSLCAFLMSAVPRGADISSIRVENASTLSFDSVVINGHDYGALPAGAMSKYLEWGPAYRYASVRACADDECIETFAVDYVGEKRLGVGQFVYVLSVWDSEGRRKVEVWSRPEQQR